jgi:hypothetical protein
VPMDIFDSCVRGRGDLAGVFEYDGETGYFYLYEVGSPAGQKVVDSIHIFTGEPDFEEADVEIRWDAHEEKVGLFIRGTLWALFDPRRGEKHGGNYQAATTFPAPSIPADVTHGFGGGPR